MSYNLFVTYKDHWSDETGKQISHKKFVDYVEANPKDVTFYLDDEDKNVAIFMTEGSDDEWFLKWENGNIRADMRIVPKEVALWMIDFAEEIGAKLTGEDGEVYTREDVDKMDTISDWDNHFRQQIEAENAARLRKKRIKIAKRAAISIICLFSALGILILPLLWYLWLKEDSKSHF
jgi:hypothetical protein